MAPSADIALRPPRTFGTTGCANCICLRRCGGHPLPFIRQLGCANFPGEDRPVDTDDMNPLFADRFWELWDDVNGLEDYTIGRLRPIEPTGLPRYLPLFQDRFLRRSRLFDAPAVALRLFDVVGKRRNGSYAPRYSTASALRTAYKLRQDTRILLVGVDDDAPLENFWAEHRVQPVCAGIADLGVLGVTAPNYSYFTCVPRFQVMRNRKRMLLAAESLSAAGVNVAPHFNANTDWDWHFWFEFLREHPEVSAVSMEFQTGSLANRSVGQDAFDQLVRLQDSLGRPLHPLLVGAARHYREAQERFASFTVIDSRPYMQTVNRQVLSLAGNGRYFWEAFPTPRGAPLDDLLETNLLRYEDKLSSDSKEDTQFPLTDPRQGDLYLDTSIPYLTAQPQA